MYIDNNLALLFDKTIAEEIFNITIHMSNNHVFIFSKIFFFTIQFEGKYFIEFFH